MYRILTYHTVADHDFVLPAATGLSVGRFRQHLDFLEEQGYQVVPLDQLLRAMDSGAVPDSWVTLTFDDGYRDNYENVFPLLQERKMPATIFVITEAIDRSITAGERELPALTRDQIRAMHATGLVTFGSHTCTHRALPALDEQEIYQELSDSKNALEELLGEDVSCVSYPFGAVDARVCEAAERAGYRWALSVWTHLQSRYALLRIPIATGDTPLRLRAKMSRLYFPLKRVRDVLTQ